jgi:hypothetical protein
MSCVVDGGHHDPDLLDDLERRDGRGPRRVHFMNTNYIVIGLLIGILMHLKGITLGMAFGNVLEMGLMLLALWLLGKLLGKLLIICERVYDYFAARWWIGLAAPISVIAVGVPVLALMFMGRR